MKKRFTALCLILCLLSLMTACGRESESADFYLYYLNMNYTGIVPVEYEMEAQDAEGQVREALRMLSSETKSVDYMKTIPEAIKVEDFRLDNGTLAMYFNAAYTQLETYTEVMVRAAVVKTLLQIPGVDSITFYVAGNPLQDSTGQLVGAMDSNSFIDDFGQESESLLTTTLTLYYASADGQSLIREQREVHYSSNTPLERLALEYLMQKPETEGAQSVFPSGTKLISVSVSDGVCYVNLDNTFLNRSGNISENVAIYSIVNSLTELDQVSRVQLLFNGGEDSLALSGISQPQNNLYEKNLSLLQDSGEEEE